MRRELAFIAIMAGAAFAQASASGALEVYQAQGTLLGDIARDWQIYTILMLMLTVGMVALAYMAANAFSMPDLKAWADVELGEIFASALILIFIIGMIVFIDEGITGLVKSSFPVCGTGGFCPAQIADKYLDGYLESAEKLHRDIMVKGIDAGNEATKGSAVGTQDLIYGYISFRYRYTPEVMMDVETYDQLLQNLGNAMSAIHAQGFLVKFMTFYVAPLSIFLGIVLRSFFLTRRLGGLLLAFGLGFLIIFPMNYALAWFTLDSMVYGGEKAKLGAITMCPEVCRQSDTLVEYENGIPSREVEMEELQGRLYTACLNELHTDESGRDRGCMGACTGGYTASCENGCAAQCQRLGLVPPHEFVDPTPEWTDCMDACTERENCYISAEEKRAYCEENECLVVVDAGSYCNEYVDSQIRRLSNGTIGIGTCAGGLPCDEFGYCLMDLCGYPIPYYKKECKNYAMKPTICNTRPFEPDDPAYFDLTESELYGCPAECRSLPPMKQAGVWWDKDTSPGPGDTDKCYNAHCVEEDVYGNCKETKTYCPSQCMWITTGAYTDPTCPETCEFLYPENPMELWEQGRENDTCVYIIPDVVFEQPELCGECAFVVEKGLTMKPQMIIDCGMLCGAQTGNVMAEDPATMTANIGGMVGPAELISVSKLLVPAYVLPMFALAVTIIFITALSPMLGGDIDIPGMMRLLQ